VMEYLDGLDLSRLVQRYGPQPPERVVHILRQACGALEEAHARGLVHRDIKPANIVLCRRGDVPDVVKVLDFGLVKDLGSPDETRKNVIAGTPAYLSPEAIEDPDAVGPASDLYALGAVGYFLITGEQLFDKKTLAALCAAHLNERPVAPSQRLGSSVPEVLEELVMKCLEKVPAQRPENAQELRHQLELADLDNRWVEDEARAWWTKHEASEPVSVANDASATPPSVTVDVRGRRGLLDVAPDDVA
jgi:serine/threonine protein kinase